MNCPGACDASGIGRVLALLVVTAGCATAEVRVDAAGVRRARGADAPGPEEAGGLTVSGRPSGCLLEVWAGVRGNDVADLIDSPAYGAPARRVMVLGDFSFEDLGDGYGSRARALIVPPATGEYTFWIASDDGGELWLSADESEAGCRLVARVEGYTAPRRWDAQEGQRSSPARLEAGKAYFAKAFQKEGGGGDHMSVAWKGPGFEREVVTCRHLLLPVVGRDLCGVLAGEERPRGPRFEAFPRTFRSGAGAEIVVRPAAGFDFAEPGAYSVAHWPTERLAPDEGAGPVPRPGLRVADGAFHVRVRLDGEQEHVIAIREGEGEARRTVHEFRVYSLRDDLFARRPWRGDFHIHSNRSDGKEPPAEVAAECRRIGLDFFALTDHRKYEASLEARRAFEGVEVDLRMFPGEEVHSPGNPIHIVSFGADSSISALFTGREAEAAWRREAAARSDALPALPPGVDRFAYASAVLCFEKIRERSGLGILAHPYWFTGNRYAAPGPLTRALLERKPYDALEVTSGFRRHEVESNTLQASLYHEERARGRPVPVVGVSDGHGCRTGELFGWYYTIVFAPSPELADIVAGVKGSWSVAVEALPGESPRPHGPFRLVKYSLFLLREVFPEHDRLCEEEGRLMLEHARGDRSAAEGLRRLSGGTAGLRGRLWDE